MGKFIGLVLVALCLAAGFDLSSKPAVPVAANCSGYAEASLTQQLALKAWVFTRAWTVQDLLVFRIAKTGNPDKAEGGDFILIQLPFTGGLWYKA
jgi:hypothetical protein